LRVAAGATWEPDGPGGAGGNLLPVPNAGPDQEVCVGELVILDGSRSYDPDVDTHNSEDASDVQHKGSNRLRFLWSPAIRYYSSGEPVYTVPVGSAAIDTLRNTDQEKMFFEPDVPGEYAFALAVTGEAGDMTTDQISIFASLCPGFVRDETEDFEFAEFVVQPNPFSASVSFSFEGTGDPDTIMVSIYSPAGLPVWTRSVAGGRLEWEGDSDTGHPTANGPYVYIITLSAQGKIYTDRGIVFLRH